MAESEPHIHDPQDLAFDRLVSSLKDHGIHDDRRGVQTNHRPTGSQDVRQVIMTELAPLMAVRLLQHCVDIDATASQARPAPASAAVLPTPPALVCIGAGVVDTARPGWVRVHLQFGADLTVPVEIPHDAAIALVRVLQQQLGE